MATKKKPIRLSKKHIEPKKTAILVIDFQNDFCHPKGVCAKLGLSRNRKAALATYKFIAKAEKKGVKVIFFQQIFDRSKLTARQKRFYTETKPCCKKGSWGAEYYNYQPPKSKLFTKYNFDIWQNKRFARFLDKNKINNLIITGVETTCCILFAVLGADERGFKMIMPKDLISSADSWKKESNLLLKFLGSLYGPLTTSQQILKLWKIKG